MARFLKDAMANNAEFVDFDEGQRGFNIDYAQADDVLEAYRLFCGAKAKISLKSFKQAIGRAEASRCIAVLERLHPKRSSTISYNNDSQDWTWRFNRCRSPTPPSNPPRCIAIIGDHQSWKSTLLRLLARRSDPTEGQILLDGNNLRSMGLSPAMLIQGQEGVKPGTILEIIQNGKELDVGRVFEAADLMELALSWTDIKIGSAFA